MKYWRGYLVAGIIGLFSWLLIGFASSHIVLMDMVYPYVSRMLQSFLAGWSGAVDFNVWQVLLGAGMLLVLGSAVLMIILRWNPIQWFGWILAGVSLVFFMNTAIYGLNAYSSPIAEDIRLNITEYTLSELEEAAIYYRDQANALSAQVPRENDGSVKADLPVMMQEAVTSYENLVYKQSLSVFAGVLEPVKILDDPDSYTEKGLTGTTVPLTGEAAVNPQVPGVGMPFAICHEMAHRMCISQDRDADMSAFLACRSSSNPTFRYSAYVMAYRICYRAMLSLESAEAKAAAQTIHSGVSDALYSDLLTYDRFAAAGEEDFLATVTDIYLDQVEPVEGEEAQPQVTACDLLVSWHIQEIILPMQEAQNERFDPFDESQVDLSGIVNAKTPAGG